MNYNFSFFIFVLLFYFVKLYQYVENKNEDNLLKKNINKGFALIYNENLKIKLKKIDNRSLNIYHKSLKKKSTVKIINPKNDKYLIAKVKSNKVKFLQFL